MYSKCFFMLALAFFGASASPLATTSVTGTGPTVSETVITPFHRTDAVSTPCGQSVVRTTALPVASYGISSGFLGTGGIYPGVVGNGFAGHGVGIYPGVVGTGLIGNAGIGCHGGIAHGAYSGIGGIGGIGGAGIIGGIGGAGYLGGIGGAYSHGVV